MNTNAQIDARREHSCARAVAYASTFVAAEARNAEIWDVEGRRYIDFGGGISCMNTGHAHPKVVAAIEAQAKRFTHTCFQISPYESYVELAERLNALAPGVEQKKSMFLSAGAEAVENAIKIARLYTGRPGLITFTGGYHGRSYMTMGLSSRMVPFKKGFAPFPSEIYRVPFPSEYQGITTQQTFDAIETLFRSDVEPERVAGVILEPVQGEGGGFTVAGFDFLQRLRVLCDDYGILLIADEIQSGMGRTGKMFAIEHSGVVPDLICVGKSIGAGLPLSGVIGRAEVVDSTPPGALGGTYGGNPLACAAALAVLDIIQEEGLLARATALGARIRKRLETMAARNKLACIGDVRGLGCMMAMELVKSRKTREPATALTKTTIERALKHGLVLVGAGAFSNVIRVMVPLTAPDAIVDEGLDILEASLEETVAETQH